MSTTEEMVATISKKADPRLVFIWNSAEVLVEVQHTFVQAGCCDVRAFKNLAESKSDMRKHLSDDHGLKPEGFKSASRLAKL